MKSATNTNAGFSLENVKGDSRLTENEVSQQDQSSEGTGNVEPTAGQALMSTVLFSLVWFEWGRFIHDGILWVKDDNGISVLAEAASKEFYNRILRQIETGSYSLEDVQAIQNYCLGDFRYECLSRTSNKRPPEQDCLQEGGKSNLGNLKLSQREPEMMSQNLGQGIYRDPNPPQVSHPSLPLYRPTQDYLEEILGLVLEIRNRQSKLESGQTIRNEIPNTSGCDLSSTGRQMPLEKSANETRVDRKERCSENGGRESSNSFSCENVKEQSGEALTVSSCSIWVSVFAWAFLLQAGLSIFVATCDPTILKIIWSVSCVAVFWSLLSLAGVCQVNDIFSFKPVIKS